MRAGLAILALLLGCQFEHGTVPDPNDVDVDVDVDAGDPSARCAGYGAMAPWGSRYRVGTEGLSWLDAEMRCEMDGRTAHLAVLGDAVERDAVLMLAPDNVWIGASDRVAEMTWRDVTGGATTFMPWLDNEPSTKADEDCALVIAKGPDRGRYDAKNCPEKHLYICECDAHVADATGY
jgi:hypothetical protein